MERADLSFDVKNLVEDSVFSSLVQQSLSTQYRDSHGEITMV